MEKHTPPPPSPLEHEHESDWQSFVHGAKAWWGRYGNLLLIVITLTLATFAAWQWFSNRAETRQETAWADLAEAGTPEALEEIARNGKVQTVRVLAALRAGDLLLNDANTRPREAEAEARAGLNTRAGAMYQLARDEAETPAMEVNAVLGLAAVAENQKRFDEARQLLAAAQKLAADNTLPGLAAEAAQKLALYGEFDLTAEVAFGTAEPPEVDSGPGPDGPATRPAETQPAATQPVSTQPAATAPGTGEG